ncbi:LOW QUALITY PROTEIN: hypothetical protein CVT26_001705 [Gymnopilus dilepis]|uniref:Uncharacterized protein n=1 Tax=Gymnopilus dilepis TaxID=231916 RepID=A0A409YXB1_9AGAR|nr:LOW QUALITY PROTEIN: hypothetical protein CVT26_001705 [Gymnopilus dilepis]
MHMMLRPRYHICYQNRVKLCLQYLKSIVDGGRKRRDQKMMYGNLRLVRPLGGEKKNVALVFDSNPVLEKHRGWREEEKRSKNDLVRPLGGEKKIVALVFDSNPGAPLFRLAIRTSRMPS